MELALSGDVTSSFTRPVGRRSRQPVSPTAPVRVVEHQEPAEPAIVLFDSATSTRRYVFASLLLVNVEKFDEDDGVYLLSSEQAGVSAYGETDSEALREFHVAFDLQYRALVEESEPGDLTPRAQQIRRWFQESVEID